MIYAILFFAMYFLRNLVICIDKSTIYTLILISFLIDSFLIIYTGAISFSDAPQSGSAHSLGLICRNLPFLILISGVSTYPRCKLIISTLGLVVLIFSSSKKHMLIT